MTIILMETSIVAFKVVLTLKMTGFCLHEKKLPNMEYVPHLLAGFGGMTVALMWSEIRANSKAIDRLHTTTTMLMGNAHTMTKVLYMVVKGHIKQVEEGIDMFSDDESEEEEEEQPQTTAAETRQLYSDTDWTTEWLEEEKPKETLGVIGELPAEWDYDYSSVPTNPPSASSDTSTEGEVEGSSDDDAPVPEGKDDTW